MPLVDWLLGNAEAHSDQWQEDCPILPATLAIRSVDFDDADTLGLEVPGQTSSIGTGSFDADELNDAKVAQPAQQLLIAIRRRGEALDTEERSSLV
jgi:hypothetical protein